MPSTQGRLKYSAVFKGRRRIVIIKEAIGRLCQSRTCVESVRTPSKVGTARKFALCRLSQGNRGRLESRARLRY